MKFTLPALASLLSVASAFNKGFNIGANNEDGSCKTTQDWENAFRTLQGVGNGGFSSFRLYASSDCNTLTNAVPAAKATNSKLLVGVWTEDESHYTAEKDALAAAIKQFGKDWILAISVGSEDLYRGDTSASRLAEQIYDVRGMVGQWDVTVPVGHVDTWDAWVSGANNAVTKAVDFVGLDGYPYFQDAAIENAGDVFWEAVTKTKNHAQSIKKGLPVWITESGWPVKGDTQGKAVASVANAEKFWKNVACDAFQEMNVFWYSFQDYNANPSFGVIGQNNKPLYDLTC